MGKGIVLRLAKYKRVLQKLKSLGFVKVFSNNLGDAIGITPALVRKDLSYINLPGNKRGGYCIETLLDRLNEILGNMDSLHIVIVGCGKIGSALMQYREFAKEGISITAGFDINPDKVDKNPGIPIYHVEELPEFVSSRNIHIGIIAVPDSAASQVLDMMTKAGIHAVLNFAPVELKGNEKCIIQNVNISLEIENLYYVLHLDTIQEKIEETQKTKE